MGCTCSSTFTPKSDQLQIFPCMKNLAFHSFLKWKMTILPILTTALTHWVFKRLGECTFWIWEWKANGSECALGWLRKSLLPCHRPPGGEQRHFRNFSIYELSGALRVKSAPSNLRGERKSKSYIRRNHVKRAGGVHSFRIKCKCSSC